MDAMVSDYREGLESVLVEPVEALESPTEMSSSILPEMCPAEAV